jgi:hypothetical protein
MPRSAVGAKQSGSLLAPVATRSFAYWPRTELDSRRGFRLQPRWGCLRRPPKPAQVVPQRWLYFENWKFKIERSGGTPSVILNSIPTAPRTSPARPRTCTSGSSTVRSSRCSPCVGERRYATTRLSQSQFASAKVRSSSHSSLIGRTGGNRGVINTKVSARRVHVGWLITSLHVRRGGNGSLPGSDRIVDRCFAERMAVHVSGATP